MRQIQFFQLDLGSHHQMQKAVPYIPLLIRLILLEYAKTLCQSLRFFEQSLPLNSIFPSRIRALAEQAIALNLVPQSQK